MKEIQVGKVMLTFKGEYDSTKSYTRLDAITYKGSSYVCLADTSDTPPTANWQLLADKGADGQPGKDGQPGSSGHDGVTPHIDTATGNWFVGSTDTGIKAQGPQGVAGKDGKDGKDAIDTLKTITTGTLSSLGTGNYEIDFAAEDAPSINWGVLQVLVGTHYAQQIFSNAGATDGASKTWIRTRNYDKSEYDAWQEVSLPNATYWSSTGITYLNGAKSNTDSSMLKCRVVSIGNIHIVELKGWFTAGNLGNHNFLPQVQVPAFGFENDDYYFESKGSVTSYDSFIQVDSNAKCQIDLYSYSTQNGPSIPLNAMWIY